MLPFLLAALLGQDATCALETVPDTTAAIHGEEYVAPEIRVQILDAKRGTRLAYKALSIRYEWEYLEYPYPEHPWGALVREAEMWTCGLDANGWMRAAPYRVVPRGTYNGKYVWFPFPKPPRFIEVVIVAVTPAFANVHLKKRDLARFAKEDLVVHVEDGWRTRLTWVRRRR